MGLRKVQSFLRSRWRRQQCRVAASACILLFVVCCAASCRDRGVSLCDPRLRLTALNGRLDAEVLFTVRNPSDHALHLLLDDYSLSVRLYYADGAVYDAGTWGQVCLAEHSLSVSNAPPRLVPIAPHSDHRIALSRESDTVELPPLGLAKLTMTYRCWSPYVKEAGRDLVVNGTFGPCDVMVESESSSTGKTVVIVPACGGIGALKNEERGR